MKNKGLLLIVVAWLFWKLLEHYLLPSIFVGFTWLGLSILLLVIVCIQVVKLIIERKMITRYRVIKITVFFVMFCLTLVKEPVDRIIEKLDWYILYDDRVEIVNEVKERKLNPITMYQNHWTGGNNSTCKLPYQFPIVSHDGNNIEISRSNDGSVVTVTFWIYSAFFGGSSKEFVYTTDRKLQTHYDELIKNNPSDNWKIEDNWYRIVIQ